MGLGGYLTWTAVAREIRKKYGSNIKLLPVEQYASFFKFIEKDIEIFRNNDDFCLKYHEGASKKWHILPLVLNNPDANYCKKDTPQKAFHRYDKHIIEQICDLYGIDNPELKCYIPEGSYSSEEWFKKKMQEWFGDYNDHCPPRFLTIEPNSKTNYTPNRSYPFENWQKIVNGLKNKIPIVQVGVQGSRVLENVIDWTGKTTFFNTARMIGYSNLFLSTEGGLVHAATAFNKKWLHIHKTLMSIFLVMALVA